VAPEPDRLRGFVLEEARGFHPQKYMSAETKSAEWIPPEPAEENIRLLAYQLWLNDGQAHGRDLDHWLTARQLLLHEAMEQHENGRPRAASPERISGAPVRDIAPNQLLLTDRRPDRRLSVAAGGAEQRRRARHQPPHPHPKAETELAVHA
jgi:hypothetical protein